MRTPIVGQFCSTWSKGQISKNDRCTDSEIEKVNVSYAILSIARMLYKEKTTAHISEPRIRSAQSAIKGRGFHENGWKRFRPMLMIYETVHCCV